MPREQSPQLELTMGQKGEQGASVWWHSYGTGHLKGCHRGKTWGRCAECVPQLELTVQDGRP